MSLVSWYPLNKDFKDYGFNCYDFDYDWRNVRLANNGKFGDALDCTSKKYRINKSPLPTGVILKEFSICFWVYHINDIPGGNILSIGNNSGLRIRFNNVDNAHLIMHYVKDGTGVVASNDANVANGYVTASIQDKTWTHVAIVYDGEKICGYLNGQLSYTQGNARDHDILLSNQRNYMDIGGSVYTGNGNNAGEILNGYLNDVRIYDNAISEAEIKLISQGLFLHYNFNDPYCEPTVNIPHTLRIF